MLSQRHKIIILVTGGVIIFVLIAGTLFGWWRKSPATPGNNQPGGNVDLSFLNEPVLGQNLVFDASNPDALKNFDPRTGEAVISLSAETKQAQDFARWFVEHFGTYSSDANFDNIDDLQSFMTPTMQAWSKTYRREQSKPSGYYAITAEVATIEAAAGAVNQSQVTFDVVVNRNEKLGSATSNYQQKAVIELWRDSNGEWKVNGLTWGMKL